MESACLLKCSFSQNGPIFEKFPVIFLQLFVPDPDRSHLSPRFAPGSGGVEQIAHATKELSRLDGLEAQIEDLSTKGLKARHLRRGRPRHFELYA